MSPDASPERSPAEAPGPTARGTPRRGLLLGAGALALAAGWGAALWRERSTSPAPAAGTSADPVAPSAAAGSDALWPMRFERPEGGTLAMADFRGKPLVINFWATWCPPCIRELPLIERFHQAQSARGWQVIALAIDNAAAVRGFLQKHRLSLPVGLGGVDGSQLVKALGNAQGGLPFTVLVAADGRIAARHLGEISEAELARWAGLA